MPAKGQTHTWEHRQKMSEMMTGRTHTEQSRQAISKAKIDRFLELERELGPTPLPKSRVCTKCGRRRDRKYFLVRRNYLKSGIIREYLASECKECVAKRAKKWRDARKADGTMGNLNKKYDNNRSPAQKKKQQEHRREMSTVRSREEGRKPGGSHKRHRDTKAGKRLLVKPFADWLVPELARLEMDATELAKLAGMDEKQARRALGRDNQQRITLKVVDQILSALDRPEMLTILYPK